MRRDFWICLLIVLYSAFIGLLTLKPVLLYADENAQSQAVLAEVTSVRFEATPGSPDPNKVFNLVNQTRQASGSPTLVADAKLGAVATARAADMANRQYFAHQTPEGTYYYDLFPEHGITSGYSCENLNITFVPDEASAVSAWQNSTKHQACMTNSVVAKAGYGVAQITLVQFDGKQVPAYVVVGIHAVVL